MDHLTILLIVCLGDAFSSFTKSRNSLNRLWCCIVVHIVNNGEIYYRFGPRPIRIEALVSKDVIKFLQQVLLSMMMLIMFSIGQLVVHRCMECGQPLPESYQPPADEDWTTGICGCAEDFDTCKNLLYQFSIYCIHNLASL